MLIGVLAREAGLTHATIRFYEKKGLLGGERGTRRPNNYKEYGPEDLDRLRFIRRAKGAGFTLSEISRLLLDWDALGTAERRKILSDKIGEIERRMTELAQMKTELAAKLVALPTQ